MKGQVSKIYRLMNALDQNLLAVIPKMIESFQSENAKRPGKEKTKQNKTKNSTSYNLFQSVVLVWTYMEDQKQTNQPTLPSSLLYS